MKINIYFFNKACEKQRAIFTESPTFLALYNHSHFIRMYVHNAWLYWRKRNARYYYQNYFLKLKTTYFYFLVHFKFYLGLCRDFEIKYFDFVTFFIRGIIFDGDR